MPNMWARAEGSGPSSARIAMLAAVCTSIIVAATAPAASGTETPGVLLTKEEGKRAVVKGESAEVYIKFIVGLGGFCEGVDEAARVPRNPYPRMRINGSGIDEASKECFVFPNKNGYVPTDGTLLDKHVAITSTGEIRVSLIGTVDEGDGCVWEVKTLRGRQEFPGFTAASVSGKAHPQPTPEGKEGCNPLLKSQTVEGEVDVSDLSGETFGVSLIG
jgi:hypothetical protein